MNAEGLESRADSRRFAFLLQHNNIWKPYDETCETSQLMKGLLSELKAKNESRSIRHRGPLRSHDSSRPTSKGESEAPLYPWLVNATILMQGES